MPEGAPAAVESSARTSAASSHKRDLGKPNVIKFGKHDDPLGICFGPKGQRSRTHGS